MQGRSLDQEGPLLSMAKSTKKTLKLRECCGMDGATINAEESTLLNVKVLGSTSQNGRQYTMEARQAAIPLYEGLRVNIDHPDKSPNASRSLRDRFGKLVNVRNEADGTRADLRFNPAHSMAATVKWFAENDPDCLGLSHNAVGQGEVKSGVFVIEKIVSVRSVDLVADPATTKGLFEAVMDPELDTGTDVGGDDDVGHEEHLANALKAIVTDDKMDAKSKKKKVLALMKMLDDGSGDESDDEEPVEEDDEEPEEKKGEDDMESLRVLAVKEPGVKALLERLDRLEVKTAVQAKRELAESVIESARLPNVAVTTVFLEQLIAAKDKKAMQILVEDRRRLVGTKKPVSYGSGGSGSGAAMTKDEFKGQLKKGVR